MTIGDASCSWSYEAIFMRKHYISMMKNIVSTTVQKTKKITSLWKRWREEHTSDLADILTKIEQQEQAQEQAIKQETEEQLAQGTASYQKFLYQREQRQN